MLSLNEEPSEQPLHAYQAGVIFSRERFLSELLSCIFFFSLLVFLGLGGWNSEGKGLTHNDMKQEYTNIQKLVVVVGSFCSRVVL